MQVEDILNRVRDVASVRQVFGEPYDRDGTLVVPVARIRGGGGGGKGSDTTDGSEKGPQGWGGGFGVDARPLGVYVIRDGKVSWQPAVDVTRIVLQGQLVAIFALLVARRLARRRRAH
ncbi:MAG: spore germination protein GerW family protein [Candidatus Dormiibacterota bacterium]